MLMLALTLWARLKQLPTRQWATQVESPFLFLNLLNPIYGHNRPTPRPILNSPY
ncbi:hypothetical protein IAD21_00558 [Abditibacteriota bacterium]|nr:hypothetical protein IAD21_00558 [Abditibacteriota bacterium]